MTQTKAAAPAVAAGPHPVKTGVVRQGKTARDRANGAKQKNYENKQARASWQNDSKSPFPYSACNGKRNRYQVTGEGNKTVYLRDGKK